MNDKINLGAKLAQFAEHWAPRTVAQLNDYDVMVVKVRGEFVWHKHDETDDFFLVLRGRLIVRLRDRDVRREPGELFVVPRGVEHQTVAEEETHLLLIEPTGTPNTDDEATAAPARQSGACLTNPFPDRARKASKGDFAQSDNACVSRERAVQSRSRREVIRCARCRGVRGDGRADCHRRRGPEAAGGDQCGA